MLFTRNRITDVERLVEGLLDSLHNSLVVVRQNKCEILYANATARQIFQQDRLLEQSCKNFCRQMLPTLCSCCPNRSDDCKNTEETQYLQSEDNHWYAVESSTITWIDTKPAVLLTINNADKEQMSAQKLYQLAYTDSLTRLPNREKLMEEYQQVIGDGNEKLYGTVALFDMDYFKKVNDTYGHSAGNVLLKRLAQHLQANPEFDGHLYRLGGDEFVFFFTQDKNRFQSEEVMRRHYEKLFENAFYSYTMPNIDLECTISMGVSYYPAHGSTLSELLRKADIALYKAKDGGRNRMVIFEDWQDTARKFSDYYINIRPVLSTMGNTYGYELSDNFIQDSKRENTINLNMNEYNQAIDALDPGDLESGTRYFIRYTNQLNSRVVLNNLPQERFVVQIPDGCQGAELENYRQLQKNGYRLIADKTANMASGLLDMADYVRITVDSTMKGRELIRLYPDKTFIAAGIDTAEIHEKARKAGFELFQGRYYAQPVVVKTGKDIDPLKVNYFRLLTMTSADRPVDFKQISDIISTDIALTYKLLRLLNSAATGLRNQVSSVPMAIAYLGEETLKKWIALLALRGLMSDKPMEIVRVSLIRARFGELLASAISPEWDSKQVFITGMFSLLHVAMDITKDTLVDELSLSDDIRQSLLTDTGLYSDLVLFFCHYEYSNWDEVTTFAQRHGLSCKLIYSHYIASVKWFNTLVETDALQEAFSS